MKKKELILLAMLLLFACLNSFSQVTIGSKKTPNPGTVLDLKEYDGVVTSTKGMVLPRVNLTSATDLFPMFKDDVDYNDPSKTKKSTEDELHIGLTVYNVKEELCEGLLKGVYVWDGAKWTTLREGKFPGKTSTLVDLRDPAKPEKYQIGEFGNAGWWMLENLRAEKWPNNDPAAENMTLTKSEPVQQKLPDGTINPNFYQGMFYYPNFDEAGFKANPHHGYMYNYNAVSRTTKDATDPSNLPIGQGICPDGWHVPSFDEWRELRMAIVDNYCQYTVADNNSDYAYMMQSNTETLNGTSRPAADGGFDSTLLGGMSRNQITGELSTVYHGKWSIYWLSNEVFHRYAILLSDNPVGEGSYSSPAWWVAVRCKADDTTVITPNK